MTTTRMTIGATVSVDAAAGAGARADKGPVVPTVTLHLPVEIGTRMPSHQMRMQSMQNA